MAGVQSERPGNVIVTPRFVYIHLHKSGGTFVNEALLRFYPGARQFGYHLPRHLIPDEYRSLPVLGFVRNPWAYYVSWYSFQKSLPRPNALFRCMSEEGTLDFAKTLSNMLNLGAVEPGSKLDELLEILPASYVGHGLNLPRTALAPIRGSGLGFYSYLFRYMFEGGSSPLHVGKTETLREAFVEFLKALGNPVPAELERFVAGAGQRNVSRHDPYASYYDPVTRELVAEREASLISRFQYSF